MVPGPVFLVCGLVFLLLLCFLLFFFCLTRTSLLAPTARTLLGGLEHALLNFFVVAARLFLVFASILLLCCWSAQKSLAPRTRTLLGVWGDATLNFVAVATLLFFFFCVCPKFCDLAKQRRKIFVGFLRSEKSILRFVFSGCLFLYSPFVLYWISKTIH